MLLFAYSKSVEKCKALILLAYRKIYKHNLYNWNIIQLYPRYLNWNHSRTLHELDLLNVVLPVTYQALGYVRACCSNHVACNEFRLLRVPTPILITTATAVNCSSMDSWLSSHDAKPVVLTKGNMKKAIIIFYPLNNLDLPLLYWQQARQYLQNWSKWHFHRIISWRIVIYDMKTLESRICPVVHGINRCDSI